MRWAFLLPLAACSYHPGTYRDWTGAFAGTRREVACVELAIAVDRSSAAEGPVVVYSFGNRCSRSVVIDLRAIRVEAADGHVLAPYDPRGEIVPTRLPARWSGSEHIEYEGAPGEVCVDAGSLVVGEHHTTNPVCP